MRVIRRIAVLLCAPALTAQQSVEVTITLETIADCPASARAPREQLFAQRLREAAAQTRALLGDDEDGPAIHVAILERDDEAFALARASCQTQLQGLGVLGRPTRHVVLAPAGRARDDALLWRAAAHATSQLRIDATLPRERQQALGYGWLAAGIAHRVTLSIEGGVADAFVVGDTLHAPTLAFAGDLRAAASELLRRDRLSPLADLLRTEQDDFDLGQHVLALALVDFLADTAAPTTHGAVRVHRIARLLARARGGELAEDALPGELAADLGEIERQLHAFVRKRAPDRDAPRPAPLPHHAPHPHAAVFVYTRPPVRARHEKVVRLALEKRHAAHTSGWQRTDDGPLVAIGPVNQKAGFWHGDELVKSIPRTWPMVAVLEYAPAGGATALLDCFRRVEGRRDDDGWMLDPTVGFVAHHNAQVVTDRDDTFHYLAIPDTPTGGHVGNSEFVHRGRVSWSGGATATVGVWTRLHAPKTRGVAPWHAVQVPLVDWCVAETTRSKGATAVSAVEDPTRQLAVWATARVFEFPVVPPGLTPGR